MKRWSAVVLVVVAAVLTSPASALAAGKWRMGLVRFKADTAFELAGWEKGFYRELGLDVEPLELPGDAEVLRALTSGACDIAEITPAGVMAAIEKGAPLKIVASFMPGLPHVFFAAKGIHSLADLADKRIAVSALGALPHVVAQAIFDNHGVDWRRVEWLQVGGDPDRVRAIVAGRAAGSVASIELDPVVKAAGGTILAVAARELPNWIRFSLVTTDRVIKERPDDLTNALVAQARGIRWVMEPRNKAEVVALMAKYGKRPPDEVAWLYDWFLANRQFNLDGAVSEAGLTWMQELNVKAGRQKAVLPLAKVVTSEFLARMRRALGEAK
jgi:ABC-type nitrate/sulfonate/bicarbonate transport system substrate-binding protein